MVNNRTRKKIYLGAVLFLIFVFVRPGLASAKKITPQEASQKVVTMANTYFVPNKNAVLSGKPIEESGLYKVNLLINDNTEPFYLTKDGALLIFPNGIVDIVQFEKTAKKQQEMQKEKIPQTKKPVVELFVMSLCPYGIKAEKDILPLIKSFGDKINFQLKFIVHIKGVTLNDVDSLHGKDEVREDARQAAILHYCPDKFSAYIDKINENACVISCGAVKLEDYWKKAAGELSMDIAKIESFAYGQEAMDLLKQNEAETIKYGVNGSPTLIINGVASSSIYHGAEAVQRAICSAFTEASCSECK